MSRVWFCQILPVDLIHEHGRQRIRPLDLDVRLDPYEDERNEDQRDEDERDDGVTLFLFPVWQWADSEAAAGDHGVGREEAVAL